MDETREKKPVKMDAGPLVVILSTIMFFVVMGILITTPGDLQEKANRQQAVVQIMNRLIANEETRYLPLDVRIRRLLWAVGKPGNVMVEVMVDQQETGVAVAILSDFFSFEDVNFRVIFVGSPQSFCVPEAKTPANGILGPWQLVESAFSEPNSVINSGTWKKLDQVSRESIIRSILLYSGFDHGFVSDDFSWNC